LHGISAGVPALRQAYFYSSDPVWEAPWVFFHRKSVSFAWRTLDDLKQVRIGGTLGYMYTPEFRAAERSGTIQVDRASSDALGFKKLLGDRFDLFPQLIDVGYYQLQTQFDPATASLFTHHPKPLGTYTETLLLSKKREDSQRWGETFNRGLRKLRKSGRYQQFFQEYLQAYRH
jgi:polar amino acid transport system substrate-binding protein